MSRRTVEERAAFSYVLSHALVHANYCVSQFANAARLGEVPRRNHLAWIKARDALLMLFVDCQAARITVGMGPEDPVGVLTRAYARAKHEPSGDLAMMNLRAALRELYAVRELTAKVGT